MYDVHSIPVYIRVYTYIYILYDTTGNTNVCTIQIRLPVWMYTCRNVLHVDVLFLCRTPFPG